MMTKEGSTKIVNFMIPRAGVLVLGRGHISHIVKMYYFFKKSLPLPQAYNRQAKCIVMMTEEVFTKIVNCMMPGVGDRALKYGHIRHIAKNKLFILKFSSILTDMN